MVSKIAVIALVLIVSCPILMGYAMNISETTVTEYKQSNDPVIVTPLLQNSAIYSDTRADVYQLNTNFDLFDSGSYSKILPYYVSTNSAYSSYPLEMYKYDVGEQYPPGYYPADKQLNAWYYSFFQSNWYGTGAYLRLTIYAADHVTVKYTYDRIHTLYTEDDGTVIGSYYSSSMVLYDFEAPSDPDYWYSYTPIGGTYTASGLQYVSRPITSKFLDISSGFYFRDPLMTGNPSYKDCMITLPERTKSALFSIDLDSITDSSYSVDITAAYSHLIRLQKTTTGGVVSWTATNLEDPTEIYNLYYDPSISHNTYQILVNFNDAGASITAGYDYYDYHVEIRYVGNWPSLVGEANVYQKYTIDKRLELTNLFPIFMDHIGFGNATTNTSPILRMDSALFEGVAQATIKDKEYTPSSFRDTPSTTITNPAIYGTSLVFGGNTYNVTNGNIQIGTHEIPIKNLVLDSVPVVGGYENRINGNVISTTAKPSTITFNGTWSATITTYSMESSSVTKTDWTPGQFAWNGVDDNFLMAGLFTIMGVFIGLGIYAKARRLSVWPLLIVCGGAAALFLFMI